MYLVRRKLTQESKLKVQNYNSKVKKFLVSVLTFDFCALRLSKRPAFTLIEFMVAMTLVATISGIAAASFVGTQKTGRDGRRKADLEAIRSALEIYRSDNGTYLAGASLTSLAPNYIVAVPTDPSAGRLYGYVPAPAACNGVAVKCTSYTLCAALERTTTAVTGCGSCGAGMTCSYKTANP